MKKLSTQSFFGHCYAFRQPFSLSVKIALLTAAISICSLAKLSAQNLVLNPSFETTSACPFSIGEFDNVTNWHSTNTGFDSCSSPDLYAGCAPVIFGPSVNVPNALMGYQYSRTGTHHAGIILADGFIGCSHIFHDNYREYIEGTFSSPLVAGQRYLVRFYVSLGEAGMFGSNSIGAWLGNNQYLHDACADSSHLPLTPQLSYCGPPIMDTLNWTPIEWIYTAVGGERYIIIGNFKDDNLTNYTSMHCNSFNPYTYYYVDDVNVSVVQPNQCGFSIFTDSVNATCGSSNGIVTARAVGCTSPYTYVWSSPGSSTGTMSGLAAGSYTVSVTDALGCRQTATVSVNSACATTLCRNTNGSLTVSGGTAPYTWQTWDSIGRVCPGGVVFGTFCLSGTWTTTYGWRTVSSGAATTYTPPAGTDTLRVIDNAGTTVLSNNIATLPPCNACALVVTAGPKRNVSCLGGSNGYAKVNTTGGVGTLTYTWAPNVSTLDSARNLAAGTYSVTVRDANNCTGTASFAITQPTSSLSVGLPVNLPAACGANTGKVKVSVTGGTPAYTFTWSPNVSTVDSAINLAAGTYNITVSDQSSCSAVLTATVASTPAITVTAGPQTNVACSGGSTGVAHVSVAGGTAPFTYTWAPNVSTVDSARNLAAGTYNVTVRDLYGCTGAATFTITQPATALSAAPTTVPPSCGGNTGRIVLHATGGTPGYTYLWSPNVSTIDSAINLASGTYNVTITDSRGCTTAVSSTVAPSTGITVSAGAQTNVNCFGGTTGVARMTVSGGTLPYTYTWSPNVSTADSAINLAAGTYNVTVRDGSGCQGTTSFTITQPASALSAAPTTAPATCGGNTGRVVLHATGGTPGYTYLWSPTVSTIDSAINLAGGSYNITITDARGCTLATSATVASQPAITVSAGVQTNVNCFGATTGIAHVTVSGGTAPLTYIWSPNISIADSAINLAAGIYNVTVRDANNCQGTASFTITQPAAALSAAPTTSPAACGASVGRVVLHATGGTAGYTYLWSPAVSTIDSAINLAGGVYNVTITDARGCTLVTSATVAAQPAITVSAGPQVNVNCFGASTGVAHVSVSGGTAPLTYIWSPNVSTNDSAVNLAAGIYSVTVRDANNCQGNTSFTITQPATALAQTNVVTPAACGSSSGKIVFTVTGGTPAYSYVWSPNVSTTDSAINVAIGTYNVTVTDARGCILTASATVSSSSGFSVSQGPQVNVNCNGGVTGSAHVLASGGTGPYTYTWVPNVSTADSATGLAAGTYSVTVHDATTCSGAVTFTITQPASALAVTAAVTNGACGSNTGRIVLATTGGTPAYTYTWSPNVSTNDSATNLSANTYSITVADSRGCNTVISRSITISPAVNASNGPQTNVSCFGGNNGVAHVAVSGGTAPFSYLWSNFTLRDSISGVVAGTYYVVVRDANNCLDTTSFVITQPATAVTATAAATATTCGNNNGKVLVTAAGGTPAYSYTWSPNVSTADSATGLAANTYNVTVTDANGCNATATASVTATPTVTATISPTRDITCHGANNGFIRVTAGSGTAPYTYSWTGGGTLDSVTGLAQGTYTVTVSDANGCQATASATINEPAALNLSVATTLAHCSSSDGTAAATVTGGTGTMTYLWSAGTATGSADSALAAGTYTITVTDANQCRATGSFAISNFNAPTLSATSGTNLLCNGINTGSVHITATGGSPAYSYTWSPAVSTADSAVNLAAGTYSVTVRDASNCIVVYSTTLTQPSPYLVSMRSGNADCGLTNGWAEANVSGSNGGYTYQWNNPQTTDSITGLAANMYHVTVTDAAGCTHIDSVAVGVNGGPAAPAITGGPLTFCQGDSVVLTSSAASGNTWSTTATSQSIVVYTSGTFTVTQTVGGCTSAPSASVTVVVNPIPTTPAITASGPLSFCPGGSVTLTSSATTGNIWSTTATSQSITVSASGNYSVSTTQAGCPSGVSAPVAVAVLTSPAPQITASAQSVCPGDSVTLDATTAGATAYAWSNTTSQATTFAHDGTYQVTVTVNGCTGTDQITIGANAVLGAFTLPDSLAPCNGDTITLDATADNATSYLWHGITATTPVVQIITDTAGNGSGQYIVDVTNSCGSVSDSVIISFQACDCKMVMANAFTPNGDGKNDLYGPTYLCEAPTALSLHIYNRWGQKVFDSDQLNGKWDGTFKGEQQPADVYIYIVSLTGMENHKEKTIKMSGTVALIR